MDIQIDGAAGDKYSMPKQQAIAAFDGQPLQARGAAEVLCYLRDLFTVTEKTSFTRAEILVILETISRDSEIFPNDIGIKVWMEED